MKKLLYLFGDPGSGKITVARILQKKLGWKLFWLHDLDEVCKIVGRYPLPRLMDKVSVAVLEELMSTGQDIIYVRPSRDSVTRAKVAAVAGSYCYEYYPVRLAASYEELVKRVEERWDKSNCRVSTREKLDAYLRARPESETGAQVISTDGMMPGDVANIVETLLNAKR